jgi:hypothetical protein
MIGTGGTPMAEFHVGAVEEAMMRHAQAHREHEADIATSTVEHYDTLPDTAEDVQAPDPEVTP